MSGENNTPKPGAAALENMKLLKHESAIFKVPKVPKRKEKKKAQVLDEDLYVEVSKRCKYLAKITTNLSN